MILGPPGHAVIEFNSNRYTYAYSNSSKYAFFKKKNFHKNFHVLKVYTPKFIDFFSIISSLTVRLNIPRFILDSNVLKKSY